MAPPPRIAVICNLDRLWPPYEADADWLYFTLSLSASWVDGLKLDANGKPDIESIKPWKWVLEGVDLLVSPPKDAATGGVVTPVDPVKPVPFEGLDLTTRTGIVTPIDKALETKNNALGMIRASPNPSFALVWPYCAQLSGGNPGRVGEQTFRDLAGYLSTTPAPLPQALNLSLTFKVQKSVLDSLSQLDPQGHSAWSLYAAPRFRLPDGEVRLPYRKGLAMDQSTSPPPSQQWDYEAQAGEPPITAFTAPWVYAAQDASKGAPFVDLSTLWVGTGPKDGNTTRYHWHDENWIATLNDRAGGGFDLARLLAGALSDLSTAPETDRIRKEFLSDPDLLGRFRAVYLAFLRDIAGPWLATAKGTPLRREAAAQVKAMLTPDQRKLPGVDARIEEFLDALEEYEESPLGGGALRAWILLLQNTLPEVAPLQVLRCTLQERPVSELPAEAADLMRLADAVSRDESLAALVAAHWRAAIKRKEVRGGSQDLLDFWSECQASLLAGLGEVSPRKRLLRANLDVAWTELINIPPSAADDLALLEGNFRCAVLSYFAQRRQNTAPANLYFRHRPRLDHPTFPTGLLSYLQARIEASASNYFRTQVVPTVGAAGAGSALGPSNPTPAPHAVTLQVDSLGDQPSVADDVLRHVSGVGILMRRTYPTVSGGPGPWRSLNAVVPYAMGTPDRLWHLSLAPTRLTFQGDVKTALVTYNNEPLIARSPRACLAINAQLRPTNEAPAWVDRDPLLYFSLPVDPNQPDPTKPTPPDIAWSLLPELCFGFEYDLMVHAIGNGGALPAELVDPGTHPARLRDSNAIPEAKIPSESLRKLRYVRRVRVGQPRLQDQAADKPFDLPVIPSGVHPLAGELGQESLTQATRARYYFYDTSLRQGTLNANTAELWSLTIPGVDLSSVSTPADDPAFALTFELVQLAASKQATLAALTLRNLGGGTFRLTLADGSGGESGVNFPLDPIIQTEPARGLESVDLRLAVQPLESDPQKLKLLCELRRELPPNPARAGEAPWEPGPFLAPAGPFPLESAAVRAVMQTQCASTAVVFARPTIQVGAQSLDSAEARVPLLLLTPEGVRPFENSPVPHHVSFGLRRPATDLNTWERWVASQSSVLDLRKSVWAAFHRDAPEIASNSAYANGRPRKDVTIDDPCVADFFYAELVVLRGPDRPPTANPAKTGTYLKREFPLPAAGSVQPGEVTLKSVQSDPLLFTITCGGSQLSLAPGGSGVEIRLPPGTVAELIVYVPVRVDHFHEKTGKFHKDFPLDASGQEHWPRYTRAEGAGTAAYYLLSPMRMILEGATDGLPNPAQVWTGLTPAFADGIQHVQLYLDRNVPSIPELASFRKLFVGLKGEVPLIDQFQPRLWDHAAGVTVWRQVWRWNGRTVSRFPLHQAAPWDSVPERNPSPLTNAFVWDAEGFGDRDIGDRMEAAALLKARESRTLLFEEDLRGEPRALYYRFSAAIYSRYQDLCGPGQALRLVVEAARPVPWNTAAVPDRWRRLLAPCRFRGPVPTPVVRFILPLTEAGEPGDPNSAPALPGMLVVLGEPWYQMGGLVESLEAEIEMSTAPDCDETVKKERCIPELGPDPILVGEAPPQIACAPADKPPIVRFSIDSPGGFTSDTEFSIAPLFTGSWFILPPPQVTLPGASPESFKPDMRWWFAKVRLARRIEGALPDSRSAFTKAMWVQYLPPSDRFHPTVTVDRLVLRYVATQTPVPGLALFLKETTPGAAPTQTDPERELSPERTPPYHQFTRWLLLTQLLQDVRGRRTQERYVGLFRYDAADRIFRRLDEPARAPGGTPPWATLPGLRGRFIEVQQRLESLWVDSSTKARPRLQASYFEDVDLAAGWDQQHYQEAFPQSSSPAASNPEVWAVTVASIQARSLSWNGSVQIALLDRPNGQPKLVLTAEHLGGGNGLLRLRISMQGRSVNVELADAPYDLRLRLAPHFLGGQLDGWACFPEYRAEGHGWQALFDSDLVTLELLRGPVTVSMVPGGSATEERVTFLPPSLTAEPWDHLFPVRDDTSPYDPQDARARIVRMSRPVEVRSGPERPTHRP